MKQLILAIQRSLQLSLPIGSYRGSDVFIATSETSHPPGTRFPAIGIKDGSEVIEELACDLDRSTMRVSVICWAPAGGEYEAQVIGDQSQPGVLDMAADVAHILKKNTLDIYEIQSVRLAEVRESLNLVDQESGREVQQQVIIFEYEIDNYE